MLENHWATFFLGGVFSVDVRSTGCAMRQGVVCVCINGKSGDAKT